MQQWAKTHSRKIQVKITLSYHAEKLSKQEMKPRNDNRDNVDFDYIEIFNFCMSQININNI